MTSTSTDLFLTEWRAGDGKVVALPVLHGSVECADAVLSAIDLVAPDSIAVELPPTLSEAVARGVGRLPAISAVFHETRGREAVYLLIEPGEPLIEAVREGLAENLPVHFVDADLDLVPDRRDPLPDPFAIRRVGHRAFFDALYSGAPFSASEVDGERERTMAARLYSLAAGGGTVLFVVGAAHLSRIGALLADGGHATPLSRIRREGVALFNLDPDCLGEVVAGMPFLQAVREMRRGGHIDIPDLDAVSVRKRVGALELLVGAAGIPWDERKALDIAVRWAAARNGAAGVPFDRQKGLRHLAEVAGRHFAQETGEKITPWQKRILSRFLRNRALLDGRLLPDFAQVVEGGRSIADDNYAYALWRLGAYWPWQEATADIPTVSLSAEELRLGSRTIKMRRRLTKPKGRKMRIPSRARNREKRPGEWMDGFLDDDDATLCSWPPESLALEGFGDFLKRKGSAAVSEKGARSAPFRGSLEDGIDLRETIRHLAEGDVWVKSNGKAPGGFGSVVVIYDEDEDEDGSRYPHAMTWLGEHYQESDEAFYSTPPLDNVVGPGICRLEYGGLFLSYPPGRLHDVWRDPDYAWTRTKPERLLAAAIDYALERNVVYCAKRPPSPIFKRYAAKRDRKIVFVPIGSLSPSRLKSLRSIHILSGKGKRAIAKEYIW